MREVFVFSKFLIAFCRLPTLGLSLPYNRRKSYCTVMSWLRLEVSQQRIYNYKVETMRREELEFLQLKRLKETLRRVHDRVPFYYKRLKEADVDISEIRTLEDVKKLPFTTKDDLRQNYPFGLAAVPLSEIIKIHASSGTTGVPTIALYTKNDIDMWSEAMARCLTMAGLTKDDVFQITPSFSLFVGGFGFYYGAMKIGATIVPTGPGHSKRQIQLMKDLGTTMLGAIASYGLYLAELAIKEGLDPAKDTKVRKGIFGAEMWTKDMKRRIAQLWDMDVYDVYGLTEASGNGTASDCYIHDGLHAWEDLWLWEVIDPKTGERVEPEEEGELVFTTLTKEAMPLIRYRTRDVCFFYDSLSCDCGRTHRRHSSIKGRTDDMIKVSGVNVWPSSVEQVLMKNPIISGHYEIIVERIAGLDKMKVRVESKERLEEPKKLSLASQLSKDLRDALLLRPEVEVLDPFTLPRPEGKIKRVFDLRHYS